MQNNLTLQSTKEFLARVFPWSHDAADPPSYLNIHWTSSTHPGIAGRACTNLDDAVNTVGWLSTLQGVKDVYFCTTAQSEYDDVKSKPGDRNKRARRAAGNAVRFKVLCIDLDAKGVDEKSYDTPTEALDALVTFLGTTHLPRPNVIVSSGGGFHVYWVMSRALTREQWQPMANALAEATRQHGLKCDTQCTVDAARILRVPQTLNHKTTPPKPVAVFGKMLDDYSVERLQQALAPYMVAPALSLPPTSQSAGSAASINAELSAGISSRTVGPIGMDGVRQILKGCGFVKDALATGGAQYANPLWHQSVVVSAFLDNGRKFAHAFSQGHPSYTTEETDNEFDRAERDIAQRGLGWPSCRAIHDAGCGACGSCPHFVKGKSPLNLGLVPPTPTTPPGGSAPSAPMPQASFNDLPPGYKRRSDGVILAIMTAADGTAFDAAICEGAMMQPWLQEHPWTLHFVTRIGAKDKKIAIELEALAGNEWRKALQAQGFMVQPKAAARVNEFMTAWIQHLQNSKSSVSATAPFGWEEGGLTSGVKGFVYGGKLWKVGGGEEDAVAADPVMARYYAPNGDRQAWLDAAKMITDQKRPALDAILAASFGAPLVKMTGQTGLLFSAYSPESGIGKSTAMIIAQAVWAHPKTQMQVINDTENLLFNKIGQLRSLPMFWDELRGEDPKKFVQSVFRLTQGKERARLTHRITQREAGTWQTILVSASNDTISDHVQSATPTTQAGLYRLFEFRVEPGTIGQIDKTTAQRIVDRMNNSYGNVGLEYAQFLAQNYVAIDKEVSDFSMALDKEVQCQQNERFWLALMTCILMGARYANTLGVTAIDEPALKTFLIEVLNSMRAEVAKATVDTSNPANVSDILQRFLSVMQQRHTVYTNKIWVGAGRPTAGSIQLVRPAQNLDGIFVQVATEDKILRISSSELNTWMLEKRIPRRVFMEALESQFGLTRKIGHMAGGTPLSGAQQYVYDIYMVGSLASMLEGF